jgi:DNA polymerase
MPSEVNWKQLEQQIKSCHECEGMNSVELGTENAPGYGNKKSKIIFIGQSLCGKPCIDAQIPFTGGSVNFLTNHLKKPIFKRRIYT